MIQSAITCLENTTRQLKRVFVQLADTQKKKSGVSRRQREAKRKATQGKEKRKTLCQAAVVESLTGQTAEEVILPLSDRLPAKH